jgi:predicted transcriptional regulator
MKFLAFRSCRAPFAKRGRSWPQIAQQLGVGVGTAYRAHQELSKKPKVENLSRIPDSVDVAAD